MQKLIFGYLKEKNVLELGSTVLLAVLA